MIRPLDHIASAPCYWELVDDGADFKCADCQEYGPASEMIYALTPKGEGCVMHRRCADSWWLSRAKKMVGKV